MVRKNIQKNHGLKLLQAQLAAIIIRVMLCFLALGMELSSALIRRSQILLTKNKKQET
jgi:hypothetical protein